MGGERRAGESADERTSDPKGACALAIRDAFPAPHAVASAPVTALTTLRVGSRSSNTGLVALQGLAREFDVLAYLVRHAGKVVTHRVLLAGVWGPDYGGETQYLRVFVNCLRRKIEDTIDDALRDIDARIQELRASTFGRSHARISSKSTRTLTQQLRQLHQAIESGTISVLGESRKKQVDVFIAYWDRGLELLISTKTFALAVDSPDDIARLVFQLDNWGQVCQTGPMDTTAALDTLRAFRADAYTCVRYRADALVERADALLTARPAPSPPHLSLAAAHRRGWGSLYAARTHGRLTRRALRDLLARHPLADGQPIYAIDVSVWARCDAETSPERGYYYHPSRHAAGQPIVAGWAYQWLNQLGFARASGTAPLDVRRVRPGADANGLAAAQIRDLIARLPADGPTPTVVVDAGYDPVQLALDLGATRAAVLVRVRKDRCFAADPDPATAAATGRPRRHGRKFVCKDPSTWPAPTTEHTAEDDQYGRVRVRAWAGLHAKVQNHATTGTRGPKPIVRGALLLVEVGRLPRRTRKPKQLWLWWQGPARGARQGTRFTL